jgi:serine/threonine protein kinase
MSSSPLEICSSCGATIPENARFCVECGITLGSGPVDTPTMHTVSGLETVLPDDQGHALANASSSVLSPGDVIADKFEIERVIGQGGMGTVYKAKEILSGQTAALKVISQKFVGSEKAVKRLIEEGMTTRGISHPNVVQIFDIGLHGTQPYIAMEYLDGRPLHVWRGEKMANGEAVPVRVAGQIIKEVLHGLQAAHDAGVIHRDLKPENIMLMDEPSQSSAKIKIVDFGIALATKTATASGTGTGLGTQLYMAPEQIRNANAANASADLYSLSKIFYELIVGVLPTGHWQPPSGGRSDVPRGIDMLIEKGLSANRDMRPQSAAAYKQALIAGMNHQMPLPKQDTGKNWKTPVLLAGGTLAVILGAVVINDAGSSPHQSGELQRDQNDSTFEFSPPNPERVDVSPTEPVTRDVQIGPGTETPQPRFAYYNGRWADPFGGAYDITINDNGNLSGNGYLGDGTSVSIAGQLSGNYLSYSLGMFGEAFAEGTATKTDQCHFNFTTANYLTGGYSNGVFHVNHQPGQPCP